MCTIDHDCRPWEGDDPPEDDEFEGESIVLYSRTHDALPESILERIQDEGAPVPEIEMAENGDGVIYSFEWPDLIVDVTVMPLVERVIRAACHCQLISLIYDGKLPRRGRRLISRLEETRLGLRFEIEPRRDEQLRAERIFRRLCIELDPLFHFQEAFYDGRGRLLLDMDRNFDRKAKLE